MSERGRIDTAVEELAERLERHIVPERCREYAERYRNRFAVTADGRVFRLMRDGRPYPNDPRDPNGDLAREIAAGASSADRLEPVVTEEMLAMKKVDPMYRAF